MISISKHHNASPDSWIKLESGVYAVIAQDFLIWYGESSALVQIYSAMVREGNFHVLLCRLCVFQDPPQISFCMRCVLISWTPQHPWTVTVSAVYCSLLEFCYFWVKSRAERAGVAARRTVAVFAVSCSILQFCYFLVEPRAYRAGVAGSCTSFFIGHTSSFHTWGWSCKYSNPGERSCASKWHVLGVSFFLHSYHEYNSRLFTYLTCFWHVMWNFWYYEEEHDFRCPS